MESIDPENEEAWTVECAGKSIIPGTPNSDEDDPRNWLSEEGSPLKCSLHDVRIRVLISHANDSKIRLSPRPISESTCVSQFSP